MKLRKKEYGDANLVGRNIEELRKERGISQKDFIAKIQVMGCDMNPTSYSKLEGQIRSASDKEIYVISKLLGVTMEELFENRESRPTNVKSVNEDR
ncbi:MAG: helix-turn-helix transcriptional regulator [Clostridia bacterium]|nr:helix-turn-helix transcriptional regulator [Clostridia bacterium]